MDTPSFRFRARRLLLASALTTALIAPAFPVLLGCAGGSSGTAKTGPQAVTITWAAPAAISYGTALGSSQLDAVVTPAIPGTLTYSPAVGTVLTAGTQTLKVTFSPADTVDYAGASQTVSLTVNQLTPTVTWPAPTAIASSTPLSSAQLDASTTALGTFVYTPAAGSLLAVGKQTLAAVFTPTDTTDYASVTTMVSLTVVTPVPSYTFGNVAIVGGGFVTGIIAHPTASGVRYARTDVGGCYRWNPSTSTWVQLLDYESSTNFFDMGCAAIALDPTNPQNLYLAVGMYSESYGSNGQVLISNNQGATFTTVTLPFKNGSNDNGRGAGERMMVDPNLASKLYLGSINNGLWVSTNSGANWSQVTSFPVTGPTSGAGVNFIDFVPSSGTTGTATPVIYVGVSDTGVSSTGYYALYRSVDSGATWQVVPGQPTGFMAQRSVLGPDGSLYIAYDNGIGPAGITSGALYKYALPANSSPSGAGTWTNITPTSPVRTTGSQGGFGTIALDPERPGVFMVTTIDDYNFGDDIYRSTNYGATWVSLNQQGSPHDATLSPWVAFGGNVTKQGVGNWPSSLVIDPVNSNHVLYGNGQTVWDSTNIQNSDTNTATSWTIGAAGIEETVVQSLSSPTLGPLVVSGVGDLGGFVSTSVTASPTGGMIMNPILGVGSGVDFAQSLPATLARVGSGTSPAFGSYSTNNGSTWTQFTAIPAGTTAGQGAIAVSADGTTFVWAPSDAPVAYSTNKGTTWTASTGATAKVGVVADRVNPKKFYIYSAGTLQISTNGGQTFSNMANGLTGNTLVASFAAEGDLWLTANNGLYHSTNSGATFSKVTGPTQTNVVTFGMASNAAPYPAIYYNGTGANGYGFYRSIDGGNTWYQINDSAHQYGYIICMAGDPKTYGRVYIGTGGRGIIYGDSPY
jgi:hypothetical protein